MRARRRTQNDKRETTNARQPVIRRVIEWLGNPVNSFATLKDQECDRPLHWVRGTRETMLPIRDRKCRLAAEVHTRDSGRDIDFPDAG